MANQRGILPKKVKGFRDINPNMNVLRQKIITAAADVYKLFGFEHWDTPVVEYADSLGKYLPDDQTTDKGVYSFRSPEKEPVYNTVGEELRHEWNNEVLMENHFLALRYDLTAPLARMYAETHWNDFLKGNIKEKQTQLFRRYQYGTVFRFEEKLEPGRFREFWQLDFDSVGTNDISADAEVCMILSAALEKIGVKRGTYLVKVNNRKVLKGFLLSIGITDENTEMNILRVIDKMDKIDLQGITEELGKGRIDTSGAGIKGLDISENIIKKIVVFLQSFPKNSSRKQVIEQLKGYSENQIIEEGITELAVIDTILTELNIDEERVIFDPTLVRGLAYYTGPVFEVESLQAFIDEKGNERHFGAIAAGGRYDGLVQNLLGIRVPATGASIGVDRLAELLVQTKQLNEKAEGAVIIINFDDKLMGEYQRIAAELRAENLRVEIYYGDQRQLKKQLQYADQKNCPVALLLGEDELKKGVVSVRNLKLGKELSTTITDKTEWKNRVQFEVERKNLTKSVLKILK
ncbi:MAG: histidine--tRNA ligase [Prevotellaceae bacterium]|nr:histidine--tRNA ligase [Prevotellaceae bacterium]